MVSTERLLEFARKVPVEPVDALVRSASSPVWAHVAADGMEVLAGKARATQVPPSWPQRGCVRMQGVNMRYQPQLPLVLQNVTADIPTGVTAIIGRSGSGKSSTLLAMLQLVACEPQPGSSPTAPACGITIDGVDIAGVGLTRLRSAISVIPQDPILFAGSLRFNLDPFDEHTDAALQEALRRVQLHEWAQARGGLHCKLAEGASDVSTGERQCICLARAILRGNKVLLADEATANVDNATDAAIHSAIHEAFADATVIIVAHRLHTVVRCRKVLVMDAGRVVQAGTPRQLLAVPGHFRDLVHALGPAVAAQLEADIEAAAVADEAPPGVRA